LPAALGALKIAQLHLGDDVLSSLTKNLGQAISEKRASAGT